MTGTARQHYPVAISLEAVASAWVRQGNAEAGSIVQLSAEVVPRLRDASVWETRDGHGVRAAVIARPALRLEHEPLCWLAGLTAATLGAAGTATWWPDRLVAGDSAEAGAVNVVAIATHGRLDAVVVAGRWVLTDAQVDVERFATEVLRLLDLAAVDPGALRAEHANRSGMLGTRVRATLLPRGEVRGIATEVDADGSLVLTSPTGLAQRVTVGQVRRVTPI